MIRRCDGCRNWLRQSATRGTCSVRINGHHSTTTPGFGAICDDHDPRRMRPLSSVTLLREAEASMRLMADRILELEAAQ